MNDTIFAPSTITGGAIAVIRISGPKAFETERILDRKLSGTSGLLRFMHVVENGEILDDVMAAGFHAPKTYTGEDLVEINCHGGYRTVQRILQALEGIGFRPAEGGEFTKRAFLNDKMDLSQAEAVMDVITAEAEKSRKVALDQLHGSVSKKVKELESILLDALAAIDAAIDFPDEAETDCLRNLPEQLCMAVDGITNLIENGRTGRVLRDGIKIVISGRPNVGKSSLLNALCGRERAIVTEIAGTTRDTIDEKTSFSGIPVRLIDTAGIRETDDKVERIGVERAYRELDSADMILVVLDGSRELTPEDNHMIEYAEKSGEHLVLLNKSDLPQTCVYPGSISVSAATGEGMEELKKKILDLFAPTEMDSICITNERHIRAMEEAKAELEHAKAETELDCAATDIRNAMHSLGSITGSDVDADVIGRIFERFCVGK